jgi:hypothetical protein
MNARRAAEIGTRFAQAHYAKGRTGRPRIDASSALGDDSTPDERSAFEWAAMGQVGKSENNTLLALYCETHLKPIVERSNPTPRDPTPNPGEP